MPHLQSNQSKKSMTGVDVCFLRLHIFIAAEQINLFAEASQLVAKGVRLLYYMLEISRVPLRYTNDSYLTYEN